MGYSNRNDRVIADWEDKWLNPDYDMASGRYIRYEDDDEEVDTWDMTEEEFVERDKRTSEEFNKAMESFRAKFGFKKG